MIENTSFYIKHLNLEPHPEGGYFKETYRAAESIESNYLPKRFTGRRNFSTAIYYLLEQGDYSAFHRIKSDECWHFYAGQTLLIHIINEGTYSCIHLGNNPGMGETFQYVVPANAWFASEPSTHSNFCLVGCTVAPGFDFADFEIADKQDLLKMYPQYEAVVSRLCR
ncbi:cupin domain-containing protein [Segetibacter aerophilus]|uniref:DUF985 domain-containing protein n=1 Tax=Segetibacter aerophilus TaxID=670293 RepID=A0A512BI84_9BACT|nr:cupin domain-containing protein [Segetibacter aerophilus]GEO11661.1 hypothetical protein SAE01_41570 [Segetibacter aerophilus]